VLDQQLPAETVWARLKPVLEDVSVKKYFFNYKFDAHMLLNEGIRVQGLHMDSSVAIRLLSEDEPSYALKNLATKYGKHFGFEDKSATYEELFGKGGFENTPLDIGTVYACKDTHLTYKFGKWIEEQFERLPKLKDLYFNMELPIIEILFQMERNGFHMDMEYAKTYTEKLSKELEVMEKQLKEMFGDINLNSSQQLASLLYDEWKLTDKSKKRSTDKATLKELAESDHRVKLLTEYKKMFTLYNNFFLKLPEMVYKRDGKLHGNFNGIGTVTGRMSASNPNLQQIEKKARPMFKAGEGKILVGADFSGAEPRIMAHMCEDKDLQDPFIAGVDLYSTLASKIFNKTYEECGDGTEYRKKMKLGVLATLYGTSEFTLSQQLEISLEEATKMIEDFYAMYPKMAQWIQGNKDQADSEGFLETMFGRKRRFQGHKEVAAKYKQYKSEAEKIVGHPIKGSLWKIEKLKHYKYKKLKEGYSSVFGAYNRVARQSTNFRVQGSAADIMKLGMIAVNEYIKTKGDSWRMIAVVHDELILEIPETSTKEEIQLMADAMVGAVKLDVPLISDVEVMRSWGKGVKLNDWFKEE
jgi:DNA polymerase-1